MNHLTANMIQQYNLIDVSLYPNGVIARAVLDGNQTIRSIDFCNRTEIFFYKSGRLRCGWLKGNQTFNNRSYKDGTRFYLFDHDLLKIKSAYLNGNQRIDRIDYRDNGQIYYHLDTGSVSTGFLYGDHLIQGIGFMDETSIGFYDNKVVSFGISSKDQVIQDVSIKKGEWIRFNRVGELLHKEKEKEWKEYLTYGEMMKNRKSKRRRW